MILLPSLLQSLLLACKEGMGRQHCEHALLQTATNWTYGKPGNGTYFGKALRCIIHLRERLIKDEY